MEPITTEAIPRNRPIWSGDHVPIEVVAGPDIGLRCEVPAIARVGTLGVCEMRLTDPTVSRVHVTLCVDGGRVLVTHSGLNDTTLDGVVIHKAYARSESLLRVGQTVLRLHAPRHAEAEEFYPGDTFEEFVGGSVAMRCAYGRIVRLAQVEFSVLVEGETGTGKDLAARAIHARSRRALGPFVAFDAGYRLSSDLYHSALFGHEAGAFTGAAGRRPGVFEQADGGTLFFDEVGEIPLEIQPVFLRALERREFTPLGGVARRSDVRIIAATNRDLAADVNRGAFRADLYYRLAVDTVRMPPLRERLDDVPALVDHFVRRERGGALRPEVVRAFAEGAWPGNVRELHNRVLAELSRQRSPPASADDGTAVDLRALLELPLRAARDQAAALFDRSWLAHNLPRCGGNIRLLAEKAGFDRALVQRLLSRHDLRAPALPRRGGAS
jgi:DNA-binding NtrC family response regulator